MLGIMAGMYQKDCYAVGFAFDCAPRAVLFLLAVRPGARHGRYGTEGQLCSLFEAALVVFFGYGMCMAGLLVTMHITSCACARCFFLRPLVSGSHLFTAGLPEELRSADR